MKVGILTVELQYHFNKMKMTKCLEHFFNPRVTGKVMGILWDFMLGETDNKFSKVIWMEEGGNNIQWCALLNSALLTYKQQSVALQNGEMEA